MQGVLQWHTILTTGVPTPSYLSTAASNSSDKFARGHVRQVASSPEKWSGGWVTDMVEMTNTDKYQM